jgi:L-threonylcarbamoyladenylate synthase
MTSTLTKPARSPDGLRQAESILRAGGCVAVPTETVYGLACDATSSKAVANVYAAKGRPSFNPLIAHVDGFERARSLIELSPLAKKLAQTFWPGPLTIVAPLKENAEVSDLVTAGLTTLAVRWPNSDAMCTLISRLDRPLAAPSANKSGSTSPTRAAHVEDGLAGIIPLILDAGASPVGVESTIVQTQGESVVLLRPGGITRERIETVLGNSLEEGKFDRSQPNAPGQLSSHYAPSAKLRLNVSSPNDGEGFLTFGDTSKSDGPMFNLSTDGDLIEAASLLFEGMRWLDQRCERIAVSPIPASGLGEAINDRLRRAAAPQ